MADAVEKINLMAREWETVKGYIPPLSNFFSTFLKVKHTLSDDEKMLRILGIPFCLEKFICFDPPEKNVCAGLRVSRLIEEGEEQKKTMVCEMCFLRDYITFDFANEDWRQMRDLYPDKHEISQNITMALVNHVAGIKEFPLD